MPDVTLPLNDADFHKIAAQVLADTIAPAVKEQLLRNALAETMRPPSHYGGKSAIQQSFDAAVRDIVDREVKALIAADPAIVEKIRAESRAMVDRLLSTQFGLAEAFANALVSAIKADR